MTKKTIVKYKTKPSNMPYIVAGLVWALLAFVLPLYQYYSYPILILGTVGSYMLVLKLKIFKDTSIPYEEEVSYEEMELEDVLNTGRAYLDSMQESKDKIRTVGVVRDIEQILSISNTILDDVAKDPKEVKQIRKFISYYLPMLDKMVSSYVELEKSPSTSQIEQSKRKIENMLKTSQSAFTELYDSLHEEESIDIASDIKVLESLMAQEGIIQNHKQ